MDASYLEVGSAAKDCQTKYIPVSDSIPTTIRAALRLNLFVDFNLLLLLAARGFIDFLVDFAMVLLVSVTLFIT